MKTTYVAWHPTYNNGNGTIVAQLRLDAGLYHNNVQNEMGQRERDFSFCDRSIETPAERCKKISYSEIKEYDTF